MNRPLLISCVVLYLLLPGPVSAADRMLQGRVLLVGEQDELKPAVGQDVTLVESGDTARTKEGGRFRIFLKDIFKPGSRITLSLEKKGWRIQYPLDGEARVPDDLKKELIEVRLLKVGSKKFWSADRIEKFIRDTAEKSREQVRPEGKPQEIDLSRYIKEWAIKYGFSAQQAEEEIHKWVAEAEQQNDPYHLGLAAFAMKNFGEAGNYFQKSAETKIRQIQKTVLKAHKLNEEVIRDFILAGEASYNQYEFGRALSFYQQALRFVSREGTPILWAGIENNIGRANNEIGVRIKGDRMHEHLSNAVAAYRAALIVCTKEQLPQQWASTQINLGNTLSEQGIRTDGEKSQQLLAQAVTAFQDALTVYTQDHLPQQWATAQNSLGSTLSLQGISTDGEKSQQLLTQAVTAFQDALTVYTKDHLPQQWAAAQNNLGNALTEQGIRTLGEEGRKLFAQAATAFREALTVYTKERLPQDWAMTQNNLGAVFLDEGIRTDGKKSQQLLAQADTAFREALTVYTKDHLPQKWADTQSNLGSALQEQGTRIGGEAGRELMRQAIHAYELALEVQTMETLPVRWEETMGNLKVAKKALEGMK